MAWSLAQRSDEVLARLSDELSPHTSPETHAAVVELATGIHPDVDGAVAELASLRGRLAGRVGGDGTGVAAAGTHPMTVREETKVSGAVRYRALDDSLRVLARREPTMALHVHVGVPAPEDADPRAQRSAPQDPGSARAIGQLSLLAGARQRLRVSPHGDLPGVSADRPSAFFSDYTDYVEAVDALIASGAMPDPSFLWWDVRLQPALGTVEVRVMDAQSTVGEIAPLVALIQSLARLELEGEPSPIVAGAEVLAENRFLAARDGMDAQLIDATARSLVPAREMLEAMLAECRPHAPRSAARRAGSRAAAGGRDRGRPPARAVARQRTLASWSGASPTSSSRRPAHRDRSENLNSL